MVKTSQDRTASVKTAGQLICAYTERLEKAEVYAPSNDAQALLACAMGIEFVHEFSHEFPHEFPHDFPLPWNTPVDDQTAQKADGYVQRREKREPLTRILGFSIFWGLKFQMADKVFRPDPQAEALVERALIILEERKEKPLRLLDLGTGSGCLLLALLHNLPKATGIGVDVDDRSLSAAQQNAHNLGLQDRAVFMQSDWGEKLEESFDFIISNPPAVETKHMSRLDPEMHAYETARSLEGGDDGLDPLRSIVKDLDRLLKPEGVALFRAHTWDREARFFQKAGFAHVEVKGNYRQNPCCVVVSGKRNLFNYLKDIFGF